jgi:hypothetical protein
MYIPQNWEFGSALAKLRNFEKGLNPEPELIGLDDFLIIFIYTACSITME